VVDYRDRVTDAVYRNVVRLGIAISNIAVDGIDYPQVIASGTTEVASILPCKLMREKAVRKRAAVSAAPLHRKTAAHVANGKCLFDPDAHPNSITFKHEFERTDLGPRTDSCDFTLFSTAGLAASN
jgi:hypothetical protein